MSTRPLGLFITGTDTEVGKTYVTALIAKSLCAAGRRVGVYKPAASGCRREAGNLVPDDALCLWEAAGRPLTLEAVCPQCFEAPMAPHLAARAEGAELDPGLLRSGVEAWYDACDIVLVEGAGGLMSPISDDEYVADLAYDLGYPLIVVSKNSLGMINQTLQTLIAAHCFRDGLEVAGIVLSNPLPAKDDVSRPSNRAELAARCVPPILAEAPHGASTLDATVDWLSLARRPATGC